MQTRTTHSGNQNSSETSRGPVKSDALLREGADHVVQTRTEDLVSRVNAITEGAGVNLVFDPIGGPILEALAMAAAPGATIIEYGALDSRPTPYPLFPALQKGLTIRGYTLFEITQAPDALERAKDFVLRGLEAGQLRPVIDRTFDLSDIQAAHRYMEAGGQFGKIVVRV